MSTSAIPPLPKGYTLTPGDVPPLPKGYSLVPKQPSEQDVANQALQGTGITVGAVPTVEPRELGGGTTQTARRLGTTMLDKSGHARVRAPQPETTEAPDYIAQHPIKSVLEGLGNVLTGSSMPSGVPEQQQGLGTIATRTADTVTGADRPRIESAAQALGAAGNVASMGMGPEVTDVALAGKSALPLFMGLLKGYAAGKGAKAVVGAAGGSPEAQDVAEQGAQLLVPGIGSRRRQAAESGASSDSPTIMDSARESIADNLQNKAEKQYGQALNPTKERTKFLAQKTIPELLRRGIVAKSPQALADRAQGEASAATQQLNDIYENLPEDRKSPTAPMIQSLEQYKQQFQDRVPIEKDEFAKLAGNGGTVDVEKQPDGSEKYVKIINLDDNAVKAASDLQSTIQQYGENITPKSMRKARQIFDESVAKAGGYEGRSLAEGSQIDAKREAANAIREQLAKDNPEIVPLNNEINFWLNVQKIAAETAKRRVGQQGGLVVPMAKNTGKVVGAGVGYGVGGPGGAVAGGYLGGKIAEQLASTIHSTGWRTVSAVAKSKLASALAGGDWKSASAQLESIGKALPPDDSTPPTLPPSGGRPITPSGPSSSLPAFMRGIPEASGSQLPPFLQAGTPEGAARDTALFQQAKAELGPEANISAVAQRAQQLKSAPKGAVLSGEPESDLEAARRGEPGQAPPHPLPFLNRSAAKRKSARAK